MTAQILDRAADAPLFLQTASVEDQRLVQRVLARWQSWMLGDEFPRRDDIAGDIFGEDWKDCFLLDCRQSAVFPQFEHLGQNLEPFRTMFRRGHSDLIDTLWVMAEKGIHGLFEARDAILFDEILDRPEGDCLAFRAILMPLTVDGRTISHVLGAANGKLMRPIGD